MENVGNSTMEVCIINTWSSLEAARTRVVEKIVKISEFYLKYLHDVLNSNDVFPLTLDRSSCTVRFVKF